MSNYDSSVKALNVAEGPSFIIDRFAKSLEVTLTVTTSLFSFIFLLPHQEGWQGEWIEGDIITTLYMIATPGHESVEDVFARAISLQKSPRQE